MSGETGRSNSENRSERSTGVTRRRVLYALGAAGAAGAVGGSRTAAYFHDEERHGGSLSAGSLDLAIECESDGCGVDGDSVTVALPGLLPGQAGSEEVSLALSGNPGWLWLSGSCPDDALADALDVTVAYDRGCDGAGDQRVSGTLREVLLELRDGLRLGDECLPPDERACVTFECEFPNESGVEAYEGVSTEFELRFHTQQCRHNDGSVSPVTPEPCVENPDITEYHGISYIEVWGCADPESSSPDPESPSSPDPACECTKLGKLELSTAYADGCPDLQTAGITENRIETGVYDLPVDDDCQDTGYDLHVTDTREPDGETTAVAFELLDGNGDPGPDLCRVVIKGSRGTVTYEAVDLAPASNSTGLLVAPEKQGSAR